LIKKPEILATTREVSEQEEIEELDEN